MVCGEAPGGSPGGKAAAGGTLGCSLGLSEVIREGKGGCGEGDEGFPLFGGILTPFAMCPDLAK